MKPSRARQVFFVLLFLSLVMKIAYQVWNAQRPTDEEVQQRMQEGLESLRVSEQARAMEEKFNADHDRAFGPRDNTDR